MTDRTAVHVDEFLPYPPARVWTVLTDPDLMARWLMPNDSTALLAGLALGQCSKDRSQARSKPVVGHRSTLAAKPNPRTNFSGTVRCEVLELRPGELLRISWADADDGDP